MICIHGIITSTSKTQNRLITACYKCSNCGHEKFFNTKNGFDFAHVDQ
jgi:DNA replicative helicase MCM subunit Mcm2 (Cdc46/Mcm family)